MLRRQRDHYGQNKNIHANGSRENLLFIINRMILIQKKKLTTQPLCRRSFNKPNLKWDLNWLIMRALCTIRAICDLVLLSVQRLRLQLFMLSLLTIFYSLNFHSFSITHCIAHTIINKRQVFSTTIYLNDFVLTEVVVAS